MRLSPNCALRWDRYTPSSKEASLLIGLFPGDLTVSATDVSTLQPDEALVLLPAAAHRSQDGRQWVVPLHAWVYVPQNSHVRRAAIAKLLEVKYRLDVTPTSAPFFDARVNLLLADNKGGRTIVVDVAGTRVTLPPTGDNGHTRAEIGIPVTAATSEGAILTIRALLPASDLRTVETSAHLIGPTGLSIISDIDDTVKVTYVLDHRRMWESTFYKPFEAVHRMPDAYGKLSAKGAPIHYVSSSPWHLAEPLLEFLTATGLSLSSITLKHIRLKDETVLNIFRPGREIKPPEIEAILTRYPGRNFILIGDSGEDDPEVYAEALRGHSGQIAKIYIRNVTGAKRDDARFAEVFGGVEAARWALFDDPGEIEAQ
jgi:phosphatidate phosphatase APP1